MSQPNKKQKQALEDVLELLQTEFNLPKDIFKKPNVRPDLNRDPGEADIIDDPQPEPNQCLDANNSPDGTNRDCMGVISVGGEPEPYCSGNTCRECVQDRHCPENFICVEFTCLRQTEPDDDNDDIPLPTLTCSDPLALNFDDGTYSGNWSCPTNPTTCQAWLDETLPINNYTGDWLNDNCCCYNLDGISLDILPGDMNNDGILNVSDIVTSVQIILGNSPYPDIFDIYIPPSSPESDGETTWYLNELQQIANILSTEFEDTIEVNPQLSDNLQIYIDNVDVELNETINFYVSEIQTLQFLIGDLESQNTSLQNTISDYESYFLDIITQINLYFPEDDLSNIDYSLYSLTIGGYFTTFQTEITNLNTQITDLNDTIASNESTISEYISQIQTLQLLVGDLEAQVLELQGQVDSIPGLESTITNLTDLVTENLTDYTLLTTYLGLPYTLTDNNIQADYNLNDGSVTCTSYLDPEVDDGTTRCLPSTADDNLVEEPNWSTIYIPPNTWSGVAMLLPPDIEYPVSILDNSWFEDPEGTIPLTWCDGTQVQSITMFSPDNQYISVPTYLSFLGGWLGDDLKAGIYYSITTPATNANGPEGCSVSGYFKFTNNS